jgi:hypothetical protein
MRIVSLLVAGLLAVSALANPASAQMNPAFQCVTYARAVSGIDLRGDAHSWWSKAAGRYERGTTPRVGAVMAMPSVAGMRYGHVAMVSKIVGPREVLLDHANWSRRGMVERNVRAVDVSAKGDWSLVRIWHAGSGNLGITNYPVSGFIYSKSAKSVQVAAKASGKGLELSEDVLALAAREG